MDTEGQLWWYDFGAEVDNPEVSIVIPAFGQVSATLTCLLALGATLQLCETTAEVILVDDCSPIDLREVFSQARGLTIFRNPENLGFLRSCNKAVSMSRGKDVVLLNNDTVPTGTWLDHLVKLKRSRPGVTVVGARLVSENGKLQESGSIVFKDGSAWNFGRGWNWDDPRCSYPREVDYCSAAALLVDGDLARSLGPFDERFVPAYYEDTDLGFEARRLGGAVWVEPRAVVIHLEGLSNGSDENSGVKAFQPRNMKLFADKWAPVLPDQYPNGSEYIWHARSRGGRKRVLFLDSQVPRFDTNSGALRTRQILSLIDDLGYQVIFCPLNGLRSEPYTTHLEDSGVEVLGPLDGHADYLHEIRDSISAIWISRLEVAVSVLTKVEDLLPGVKIIFDTVDLHHLRLQREEAVTNTNRGAARVKSQELEICNRCSEIVVVSEFERDYLQPLVSSEVSIVSNIHPRNETHCLKIPSEPVGVFVGSFKHNPNIDAVLWFCSTVLPLVLNTAPDFRFIVVGEDPPKEIRQLVSDNVEVRGWVPDLVPILSRARMNLAPIRFGAGVKGKISQSLSLGVPTVTTSIGAEGMHLTHRESALIADHPHEMADEIINLLLDDGLWSQLSTNGLVVANQIFGSGSASEVIRRILK